MMKLQRTPSGPPAKDNTRLTYFIDRYRSFVEYLAVLDRETRPSLRLDRAN